MSENGEIYTAGKNFTLPQAVTAVTNSTSGWSSIDSPWRPRGWRERCQRQQQRRGGGEAGPNSSSAPGSLLSRRGWGCPEEIGIGWAEEIQFDLPTEIRRFHPTTGSSTRSPLSNSFHCSYRIIFCNKDLLDSNKLLKQAYRYFLILFACCYM